MDHPKNHSLFGLKGCIASLKQKVMNYRVEGGSGLATGAILAQVAGPKCVR